MTVTCCTLCAVLWACAGAGPTQVPIEELLVRISAAADRGDSAEAANLIEQASGREKTPRQAAALWWLTAGPGSGDNGGFASVARAAMDAAATEQDRLPVAESAEVAPETEVPAWADSTIRVRRTVLDSRAAAMGYDELPFFHGYRRAAACCQFALFDLGQVTITEGSGLSREPSVTVGTDRVIELNFGEFLRRAGIDRRRRVYYGETRVTDGRLLHAYESSTGGIFTGVTESMDGRVRTTLRRDTE